MGPSKSERVELRLDEQTLEHVDHWRMRNDDAPTRSEAIRRLINLGLERTGEPLTMSKAEQLIALLLCEIAKGDRESYEINPKLVADAICGGHLWALEWEYGMMLQETPTSQKDLSFVVDVLNMWRTLEFSFNKLSAEEQQRVKMATNWLDAKVTFPGFDGNEEGEFLSITRFMVEKLNRFDELKGRSLNSHTNNVSNHKRMYAVFHPINQALARRHDCNLKPEEMITILKAF
jgi:uncharacterized protein